MRGHREGQGIFGVTDGRAVLWGHHHRQMTQGWLRWDGSEPAPALGCSVLSQVHPGVLWGFWNGKIIFPFLGRLDQRESCGEALKGMWIPRDADVRPDLGKESCSFGIPSCYTCSSVPATYILSREIISHIPSCKHSLGMQVGVGRLWAELKVKLWQQPGSVPPWYVGWHSGTGTGARATSGTVGDPSRCLLCRYGNVRFNAFTLGTYIHPGAMKVFACVAAGTSSGALCGDRFYTSSGQAYAHGTYGHMRVNVYIYPVHVLLCL